MNERREPGGSCLSAEEAAGLKKGVAEFNAGHFFECHDTLEEVWSGLRGPARNFVQGLIQVAVGFYHLGNGNSGGALSMLERGLARLEQCGPSCCGLELRGLRRELAAWRGRVAAGAGYPERLEELLKLRWTEGEG